MDMSLLVIGQCTKSYCIKFILNLSFRTHFRMAKIVYENAHKFYNSTDIVQLCASCSGIASPDNCQHRIRCGQNEAIISRIFYQFMHHYINLSKSAKHQIYKIVYAVK